MLQSFLQYIHKHQLFTTNHRLLVGVSGGIDSMVLCDLLLKNKFSFQVAHCNFQLRGEEAHTEEKFVNAYCQQHQLPVYSIRFDTENYAKEQKLSIQMAARELRYQWFYSLLQQHQLDFLLTAHHLNDNIETFFINLLRGSGLNGLKGIMPKQNNTVRPLLFAKRSEIEDYALQHQVAFKEDSSNFCDKYLRNKLRLHILPQFIELNPSFEETMQAELNRLRETSILLTEVLEQKKKDLLQPHPLGFSINIHQLKQTKTPALLLHELLKNFGFNATTILDVEKSLDASSGKTFYSPSHQLTKDRTLLLISPIPTQTENLCFEIGEQEIGEQEIEVHKPVHLRLSKTVVKEIPANRLCGLFDLDLLSFPLKIEGWKKGDKFMPLGMKNFKKLSDFFSNEKYSIPEKQQQWILKTNTNEIVWIMGRRIDERFRVSEKTKQCLQIEILNQQNDSL